MNVGSIDVNLPMVNAGNNHAQAIPYPPSENVRLHKEWTQEYLINNKPYIDI